jgi:hypothetical protein
VINDLPAGTHFIWVDGVGGTFGKFNLEVTLETPAPPIPGESCPSVVPITLTGNLTTVSGTTAGAQDDSKGQCGATTGPDVVYSFELTADQKVSAKVTPTSFAPAVYIRRQCSGFTGANEPACATTSTSGTVVTALAKYLTPGTYFVWVDAGTTTAGATNGSFNLELLLDAPVLPPINDDCLNAIPLTPSVAVTGDTTDATHLHGEGPVSAVCAAMSSFTPKGPELVYSYTPTASGPFTVTVTPNTGYDTLLWITQGVCGGTGADCILNADAAGSGSVETLTGQGVAGTTYYIFVDSYSATSSTRFGGFSLIVN